MSWIGTPRLSRRLLVKPDRESVIHKLSSYHQICTVLAKLCSIVLNDTHTNNSSSLTKEFYYAITIAIHLRDFLGSSCRWRLHPASTACFSSLMSPFFLLEHTINSGTEYADLLCATLSANKTATPRVQTLNLGSQRSQCTLFNKFIKTSK